MTPHSEVAAILPIWVLVVKADRDNDCKPLSEDLQRAEKVMLQVKTYLDSLENAAHRVVHVGQTRVALEVASIFRGCTGKTDQAIRPVNAFSRKGIEENDEQEYGAFVRQVIRHFNAQIGCDVFIAILDREVINQILLNRSDVCAPHPRFALRGGEACIISRDGEYREFRWPPPEM